MPNKKQQIQEFWNESAKLHKTKYLATVPDKFLKHLEIENILKYIPNNPAKVLDVGCGNGYSTLTFAKYRKAKFTGVDYSEDMIRYAKQAKNRTRKFKGSVEFCADNVLTLNTIKDKSYDIITTDRCLINLVSLADQKKAIHQLSKKLKKKGKYIMCEDTQEGLAKLNELRKIAGLSIIPNHWHNLYLSEKNLLSHIKRYFKILKIDNFSSTYYVGSRIFNALASKDKSKPNYMSNMNKVASQMPSMGDYSPLKIFYLEKK